MVSGWLGDYEPVPASASRGALFVKGFFNGAKFFECGFERIDDFGGELGRGREVFGVFEGLVFEPEDVEVGFVSRDDFVVGEFIEAVGFFAAGSSGGLVDFDEVFEVFGGEGIGF